MNANGASKGELQMAREELRGKIQTVTGPIDAERLGVTLTHEHLIVDLESIFTEPPAPDQKALAYEKVDMSNLGWLRYNPFMNLDNIRLLDEQEAVEEARLFKQAGGSSIVDCTLDDIGRDPESLARISLSTGLNVIMGCGYYTAPSHRPGMSEKSAEEIEDELVRDLIVGVGDSGIKAGFIGEIGCSWPLDGIERRVLRAAARAQQRTGACLSIHPGRHPDAPFEICDIVADAGGDLSRTVICHIDVRLREHADRCRLAQTGVTLEYDVFGWEGHFPSYWTQDDYMDIPNDTERIYEILALIREGHLEQLLISQDICRKSARACYGGWGYGHISNYVVPMMRQRGISQEQIDTIMIANPRRLFSFV